jgi:TolC family type I secretion outer membrane protein
MRKQLLLGVALALLPLASAGAETLDDALSQAYVSNPTLQAERAQLRATDEDLPQALSQRRPTVTGQGQVGVTGEYTNRLGHQTLYPRGATINLNQPLWTGGRAGAAISQADFLIKAERANLLNVEETVLLQAATSYLDVVRDQIVLDLADSNVKVLKATLDQTRAQLDAGVATRTDLAQSEARLAQGIADRRQAQANLNNSRAAYQQAVGEMPGTLKPPPEVRDLPPNLDSATQQGQTDNPQVLFAQANHEAALAGVDLAESQLMPSLALSGLLGHLNDQQIEEDRTDTAALLLTLTVPFYQAGAEYSRIRQAKESSGQARNQIEAAVRLATQNVTDSWENLQAARAKVRSFQSQVEANQIAYNGTVEEQRVGTRTVLDVLNAQQALFGSQVNLAQAQHDVSVSAYQVKAAVGEMTVASLDLNVERYNPRRHYDAVRNKWFGTTPGD